MHRVRLDRFGELLADRAGLGVLGVGRAHDVAVALYGILALEHLHDDGTRDHERNQIVEERPLLVDGIEALGLLLGHLDALRGDDAQAGLLEHLGDGAGQIAAGGIGLDDRKRPVRGHGRAAPAIGL